MTNCCAASPGGGRRISQRPNSVTWRRRRHSASSSTTPASTSRASASSSEAGRWVSAAMCGAPHSRPTAPNAVVDTPSALASKATAAVTLAASSPAAVYNRARTEPAVSEPRPMVLPKA